MLEKILRQLQADQEQQKPIDALARLAEIFDALRPRSTYHTPPLQELATLLHQQPPLAHALRGLLLQFFNQRHAVLLLATAGIYPETGLFTETLRRISHKLLPEVDDETQLKDGLQQILRRSDVQWLEASSTSDWSALIEALNFHGDAQNIAETEKATQQENNDKRKLLNDVLEAMRIVAHRIAAAGLEPEMLRLDPSLENNASPFLALCEEALEVAKCMGHKVGLSPTILPASDESMNSILRC
jgi:site-specific recombinase